MVERNQLSSALKRHGWRLTAQRRVVIEVLAQAQGHLTPASILALARHIRPDVGLTTIYRTLELLGKVGLVERIHLEGGCYSYALSRAGHYHNIICSECGLVVAFAGCGLDELGERLSQELGFEVTNHWMQFFGRCPDCQTGRD